MSAATGKGPKRHRQVCPRCGYSVLLPAGGEPYLCAVCLKRVKWVELLRNAPAGKEK